VLLLHFISRHVSILSGSSSGNSLMQEAAIEHSKVNTHSVRQYIYIYIEDKWNNHVSNIQGIHNNIIHKSKLIKYNKNLTI
jgi:nicotinamide riboside kinase